METEYLEVDVDRLVAVGGAEAARLSMITTNIDHCLYQQPSLVAQAYYLYGSQQMSIAHAKRELKKVEAVVLKELIDSGETATAAVRLLEIDPRVEEAQQRYLAAQERLVPMEALVKGLSDRRDMLIQISARERAAEQR